MSAPTRLVNTFMNASSKPVIDVVSKIFIILELVLGVNRLPVLGVTNKVLIMLISGFSFFLNMFLIVASIISFRLIRSHIHVIFEVIRFLICSILAFFLNSRLQYFYIELQRFDTEIGYEKPKPSFQTYMLHYFQLFIIFLASFSCYNFSKNREFVLLYVVPLKFIYYLEFNFYSHLFSIVRQRITYVKNALQPSIKEHQPSQINSIEFTQIDIKTTLQFYNKMIIIYNYLYEAIKWQMVVCIATALINNLDLSYVVVKSFINSQEDVLWTNIPFLLMELVPLVTPCVFVDKICDEVRQLKGIITRKLYSNILDKSSRSTARTLLALMETEDLSFSLFGMFNIDITLPFKIFALILTYLIILLQFDKVLSQ